MPDSVATRLRQWHRLLPPNPLIGRILKERMMHPEEQPPAPDEEEKFHVWRLLGIIFVVCVTLAVASILVDWAIIGPLEGRAF